MKRTCHGCWRVKTLMFCFCMTLFLVICTEFIKVQHFHNEDKLENQQQKIAVIGRRKSSKPDNKDELKINVLDDDMQLQVFNNFTRRWDYAHGNRSKFLTIGIPSVRRPNTKRLYLYETIASLIHNTDDADRNNTRVIIFLSDNNSSYNLMVQKALHAQFLSHVSDGFIRIVCIPKNIYPDLNNVQRTFNDSKERLKWRAKQNIDFSYMFLYSRHISQYYLQLEDDVITTSHFVRDIGQFIRNQSKSWFLLEFSRLGFIGKLFKSKDLQWMSSVFYNNFAIAPCDLLLGRLRKEKRQKSPIHSNTSLFQHIGKFSSLRHKLMPSIDKTFKDFGNVTFSSADYPKGDNPPAKMQTDIQQYENYRPEFAYDGDLQNLFWGKFPNLNSYFKLIFKKTQNISRVLIVTGEQNQRKDSLRYGTLLYSRQLSLQTDSCETFEKLADFVDGEVDTLVQGASIGDNVNCLLINVTKRRPKTWLIIWRIEVFVRHLP